MSPVRTPSPDPAASPQDAVAHYQGRLALETDCADVGAVLRDDPTSVVVVDSRSTEAYAAGHVPGAVSLPHGQVTRARLDELDPTGERLFVTYCWGPHCNGATRGALAVARAGRRVKEMIGGVWGWQQEGFQLVRDDGATAGAS